MNKIFSGISVALTIGLFAFVTQCDAQELESRPGILRKQPATGRFVKVKDGYMVPFTVTIPGTNIKFEMVPIPGGTVIMGNPDGAGGRSKKDRHIIAVNVEPFWMGKHEVTWAEYERYMKLNFMFKRIDNFKLRQVSPLNELDAVTAPSGLYDPSYTYEAGDGKNTPAATMTQYAAKQYTKWLSLLTEDYYRLPAEAEWEHAARAGTRSVYYFGDDSEKLVDHAWFEDNSDYERRPVGQKKPNPWGLHDVYGNVAEWVIDQKENKDSRILGKGKTVTVIESINWPSNKFGRVCKGGSWELQASDCCSSSRLFDSESWKDEDPDAPNSPWWNTSFPATGVGFRLLRPLHASVDRKIKEKFWDEPSIAKIDALERIKSSGRGSIGLVDKNLPQAFEKLKTNNKRRPK